MERKFYLFKHYICHVNQELSLFFRKTGEGFPVVILHGLFGMTDNWQSFAKNLSEEGFAVYTVDLRNHGQSFHDPKFNYKVMSDDLLTLMEKEKIVSPVIIGHSMGGKAAMRLSLDEPDAVKGIVVVDISPRFYPVHHNQVIEALKIIDLTKIKSRKDAESAWQNINMDMATKQFLLKNLYWKNGGLTWRFNLPAIEKNINEIGVEILSANAFVKPALFIRGEKSNYITDADEGKIKSLFPLAEIKTAPGAGHWVHADNPVWLLENLVEFLNHTRNF